MKCQNDFFNFDFEVNYVTRKNKVLIKRWAIFLDYCLFDGNFIHNRNILTKFGIYLEQLFCGWLGLKGTILCLMERNEFNIRFRFYCGSNS
jgi:hypothetical protein